MKNLKISYTEKIDRNNIDSKYDDNNLIVNKWKNFQASHNLKDTFRYKYPELRRYTCTTKDKKRKSWLDRIYISDLQFSKIKTIDLLETSKQDHRIVILQLHEDITNGPGIWCFKNSLWKDQNCVDLMRKEIQKIVLKLPNYEDKFTFWEEFYVLVRITLQEYCYEKNKKFKNEWDEVTNEISHTGKIDPRVLSDEHLKRLTDLKIRNNKS